MYIKSKKNIANKKSIIYNKYIAYKNLYIDKHTGNPTKLEIQDITQKITIYILYSEIKINNLQKEDILAFKIQEISNDI